METTLERADDSARASLGEWLRAGLQGAGTFGIGPPATPVLVPPDVRRVWVPTHENAEGELVAGHWVFLRVRDARWFLDASAPRDPSPAGGRAESPPARSVPASGNPAAGVPWVETPAPGVGEVPRPSPAGTPAPTSASGNALAPVAPTSPGTGRLP